MTPGPVLANLELGDMRYEGEIKQSNDQPPCGDSCLIFGTVHFLTHNNLNVKLCEKDRSYLNQSTLNVSDSWGLENDKSFGEGRWR